MSKEKNQWMLNLLREMMRIRMFETEVYRQLDRKNIRGTAHICLGQEAVAVGCCEPLRKDDIVTSTHRGHGHFLAKGGSMKKIMAELFGRRDGYCKGKGGTQHMASVENGFLGSNGITGGGIPYATGIALAIKMRKRSNVVVCFFGDGASNQGTFHESLNIASIWKLPVIYVCENNQYAMSSKIKEMINIENIADRASSYGIVGKIVDGNDVLEVSRIMHETVEYVRTGLGPILIEAKTYRMCGHSRNDTCAYRSREEERLWSKRCPIKKLKERLMNDGLLNNKKLKSIEEEIIEEIREAVDYALGSGYLTREEILDGVYS